MTSTQPRPPVAPLDEPAAAALWQDYLAAHPEHAWDTPTVEHFGDSAPLADELLDLVLHGPKRATATLLADFAAEGELPPRIGSHWVACDGAGRPRVVLRSVELRVGPVHSVDDAFAWDEGEDDRTRATWLEQHLTYWRRTCAARGVELDESVEVVFERLRVVWPPEHAD
ncbi:ASCH domain-containing protein [Cellulomonas cellasea]|uniref:ASCH domain-containing protein n=2 Tax=Cellulomonas cellasea TaxID=43670 RepID=A0A0A0B7L1_9CELL|nr:ASCH domain-containing protein [Cellulomonas cellasea]KGM01231.1 hypothetical protein Q760_02900 [Cellulomonas cellasea DSM 20118]GEA86662.1 hypothetical protein CCE01nite_06110 [Cellulomonas cellasea]